MTDHEQLARKFAIPDVVDIGVGKGGLTRLAITAPAADANVYLHGAHVTHFAPARGKPVLFLSDESHFAAGKAIRGGVPVIFPWFGPKAGDPAAPAHGVARTIEWELTGVRQAGNGDVSIVLELSASDATRALWPHDFHLRYTVVVGKSLCLTLEVQNTSAEPWTFEEALHTYLSVGDVRQVSIEGFAGRYYLDKVDGQKRKTQPPGPITIVGETDRVYLDTTETIAVTDPLFARTLRISKEGSASTVLWNPWVAKAKALSDFGDDEWPMMLCVETANAGENAMSLAPGASHTMRARIEVG